MLTLEQYALKSGFSLQTARRRCYENVVQHTKKAGKVYVLEPGDPGYVVIDKRAELKDKKLEAEVIRINQQNNEVKKAIALEAVNQLKENIFITLRYLPEAYRAAKLTEEQSKIINAAYNRSLKELREMK